MPSSRRGKPYLLFGGIVLAVLLSYAAARYNYAFFHTSVEIFGTVIAIGAGVIVWDARHMLDRHYLLLMGIALFAYGLLSVPHMMAYEGIALFKGFTNNLPTQIFIFQRYIIAPTFLLAPLFARRMLKPYLTAGIYAAACTVFLFSVFWWRNFPDALVPGQGLTPFKIVSEYIVASLFALSLFALYRIRGLLGRRTVVLVALATISFIGSELMFTLYSSPSGPFNFLGHIFQLGAFALLYGAIIFDALVDPYALLYAELAENERRFRATFERAAVGFVQVDDKRRFIDVNEGFADMLGYSRSELVGMSVDEITRRSPEEDKVVSELNQGLRDWYRIEKDYVASDGSLVCAEVTASAVREPDAEGLAYYVAVVQDITARKAAETERQRLTERINAIARITEVAISTLRSSELLDRLLVALVEVMRVDAAAILLRDGDHVVMRASQGFGPDVRRSFRLWMGEGFAGTIAETGEPLYLEDVQSSDLVKSRVVKERGVKSMLGVPLKDRGEVIGVVHIDWLDHHPFDAEELRVLLLVADRMALGYANAVLFESEQSVSQTLQEGLISLPSDIAGIELDHLYHSASERARVGGDFYDAFETPDGRIALVMGDVSGKGVGAASLTGIVRNTIRIHIGMDPDPARVVSRTSEVVLLESGPESFVTLFLGLIDRKAGTLTYCNAGHTAAILRHPDGQTRLLEANSPLVGALPGMVFESTCRPLGSGDELYLYTDGVIEARGHAGLYGEDRLVEAVRTHAGGGIHVTLEAVTQDVMTFTGGQLSDDLAMLVVRWIGDRSSRMK